MVTQEQRLSINQVKQVLGNPSRDIGEHQVGSHVIGPPQPLGERAEHVQRDLGPLPQPRHQRLVLKQSEHRVGDRAG